MATLTTFGHIDKFSPEVETFSAYCECVELFFRANEIPDDRQVAVLLSIVGTKSYSLLYNLLAPESPSSKSVGELLDTLQSHLQPEPIIIVECYKFYQRSQNSDESVVAFIAELKRLAATCDFKTHLDEALRDHLVCGLRSVGARKKLLGQKDLTLNFHKAVELATTTYMWSRAEAHVCWGEIGCNISSWTGQGSQQFHLPTKGSCSSC